MISCKARYKNTPAAFKFLGLLPRILFLSFSNITDFAGLQLGIEVKVLLTPTSQPQGGFKDLEHFSLLVARKWNAEKELGAAKMHVDTDGEYDGGSENIEWSITDDEQMTRHLRVWRTLRAVVVSSIHILSLSLFLVFE